jgi:DNA-binding response OmpR family regulator
MHPISNDTWQGKQILVLDDAEQITDLIREIFRPLGSEVTCVADGRTAMELLQLHDYDLILLDLIMPRPDGWDVLGLIRACRPAALTRTILLTGDRYENDLVQLSRDLAIPVLYKPFGIDDLRARAAAVLQAPVEAA